MLRYYTASRLTPSQPFPVQGRPPLGIQTRTEPKTITSKHQTSAWISSTIWCADPKISQAIPSISSSRRLSLNLGRSWQSHAVTDMYIMTYHDISWHIMHNKMSIAYVHRSHKMRQIGMYWNLTEHSSWIWILSPNCAAKIIKALSLSVTESRKTVWHKLFSSYSVALIPCRMISLSQRQ